MANERIRICIVAGNIGGAHLQQRAEKAIQRNVVARCVEHLKQARPDALAEHTSVTHSRGWAAIAAPFDDGVRVGVDLEYADPNRNWDKVVSFLSPQAGAPDGDMHAALLWTGYEAMFKATGHQFAADETAAALGALRGAGDAPADYIVRTTRLYSAVLAQDDQFALSVAASLQGDKPAPEIAVELIVLP